MIPPYHPLPPALFFSFMSPKKLKIIQKWIIQGLNIYKVAQNPSKTAF
jgi:hypothetical protein